MGSEIQYQYDTGADTSNTDRAKLRHKFQCLVLVPLTIKMADILNMLRCPILQSIQVGPLQAT